jgi:predicted type IV restriction endonuclease
MKEVSGKYVFYTKNTTKETIPFSELDIVKSAKFENFTINQYESGTIKVLQNGIEETTTKPILREIASKIGVNILNDANRRKNTRQLGSNIILMLNERT